jgi:DNA-binding NarL/FixJ family response regulator
MIKVFIVDDHEIIREGIKQILHDEKDIEVVGEAFDGEELFNKIDKVNSDIIILDLNLPGKSGLEIIDDLKRKRVKSKILVFSINSEERSAVRAFKAGASGYINKDSAVNELVNSIHSVYERGRYMNPVFAEQIAFELMQEKNQSKVVLTNSEFKFATMLNDGIEINKIAEKIGISMNAAVLLKRSIFKKLNISSYIQLVHYFKDQRIKA